jgi:hypothetical protein
VVARQNPFVPGARYVPPQSIEPIYGQKPNVRFLSQAVQPPSQVYVESTDVLRVAAASSQANEALVISWRLLLPNGDVVLNQAQMSVTSDRAINIHDEPLAEGFLLSVSCKAAAATTRGQTFARIFLTDPDLGAGQPSYMLMADYVTNRMAPAHPNGRVLAPTEGPGNPVLISISNPAANHDWSVTVPTNARWRVQSTLATLTTDGTAGSRLVELFVQPTGSLTSWEHAQTQAPSSTVFWNLSPGLAIGSSGANPYVFYVPLPTGLILLAGGVISSGTGFVGAADAWSNIRLFAEEWLDNV